MQVPHFLTLPPPALKEEEPQQLAQESLEEVLPPLDAMAGVFAEVRSRAHKGKTACVSGGRVCSRLLESLQVV